MRDLRKSLSEIHKEVETSVKSSRATKGKNVKKRRSAVKFDKVHYVFVAIAESQKLSKLQPKWTGLYQISEAVSDWLLVVKHLASEAEKKVHASRLQFHSDKDLNVIIRLQKQIQYDEWKFAVEFSKIVERRDRIPSPDSMAWYRRTSA